MKKRIVAVILSMVVCFSVVGCSKTENENKSDNDNVEVVSDDQVENPTDDVVVNESADPKAETTLSNGTIEISLYDDINDVFDKLGESDKEDEFGNIIYDDFTIQCFGEGDDKELSGIFTYSKNVTTSKGISVGSTYADVVVAYGEPSFESEEDGKKIVNYTPSGYTLGFTIENDEVTAIAITAGMG